MHQFFSSSRSFWYFRLRYICPLLIGVAAILMLSSCSVLLKDPRVSQSARNPNALLGLPSSATSFNANDYLINRSQYVMSYNRSKAIPNWASWQLNQNWLGSRPRIPFEPDNTLPNDWEKTMPNDYTGSGFDRGHVVPAADRNKTADDSSAVFLMTNIFPQAPDNNQGPWAQLESYCRELVAQGKELYIVAGVAGEGGIGDKGEKVVRGTIAKGKVSVPASTWKVVLVSDRPSSGIAGITERTRVIAVIMPNKQGIKDTNWREYRRSVDQVEELTGYDLFSNIPQVVQTAIESKTDADIPPVKLPVKTPVKLPVKQPVGTH